MFEKLIRDRIPELAAAEGRELTTRIARADEVDRFLALKLIEESHEVIEALSAGREEELLGELADLETVIQEIAARRGIPAAEIYRRADDKRNARGGFRSGLILKKGGLLNRRLHVGGTDTLIDAIRKELLSCVNARIAVAFVMRSGLDLLEGPIRAALLRGANVRLLTTDYLGVTEPEALHRLCDWPSGFDVFCPRYSPQRKRPLSPI